MNSLTALAAGSLLQYRTLPVVVLLALILSCIAFSSAVDADVILGPVASTANTFGNFGNDYQIDNSINQSGLSVPYVSLVTDFESYNATHTNDGMTDWASLRSPLFPGHVDFDLGAEYVVTQLALWNDIQEVSDVKRGINAFSVLIDDNVAFSSPTNIGSFNAVDGGVGPSIPKQVFDLTDSLGRFIRINIVSNHGGPLVQVGEFAFAVSIPEPTTLTLAALALLPLGWWWRRISCS